MVGVLNAVEWPRCQLSPLEGLRLLPRLLRVSGAALPRVAKVASVWKRHDPRQRHWHLGPIGVLPQMQGRGIGSRLLEHFCAMADDRRDAVYLETDRAENVPLYERFGFAVTASEPLLSVPNWFMWRAARDTETR